MGFEFGAWSWDRENREFQFLNIFLAPCPRAISLLNILYAHFYGKRVIFDSDTCPRLQTPCSSIQDPLINAMKSRQCASNGHKNMMFINTAH